MRPDADPHDRAMMDAIADQRWADTCAELDLCGPDGEPPTPSGTLILPPAVADATEAA